MYTPDVSLSKMFLGLTKHFHQWRLLNKLYILLELQRADSLMKVEEERTYVPTSYMYCVTVTLTCDYAVEEQGSAVCHNYKPFSLSSSIIWSQFVPARKPEKESCLVYFAMTRQFLGCHWRFSWYQGGTQTNRSCAGEQIQPVDILVAALIIDMTNM